MYLVVAHHVFIQMTTLCIELESVCKQTYNLHNYCFEATNTYPLPPSGPTFEPKVASLRKPVVAERARVSRSRTELYYCALLMSACLYELLYYESLSDHLLI